jgi:hypothetical protein
MLCSTGAFRRSEACDANSRREGLQTEGGVMTGGGSGCRMGAARRKVVPGVGRHWRRKSRWLSRPAIEGAESTTGIPTRPSPSGPTEATVILKRAPIRGTFNIGVVAERLIAQGLGGPGGILSSAHG